MGIFFISNSVTATQFLKKKRNAGVNFKNSTENENHIRDKQTIK